MYRPVLKDPKLEQEFQKNGYVAIPFLDLHEIDELKQIYIDSLHESGGHISPEDERVNTLQDITYDFTFIDKNIAYKRKVFEVISSRFMPKLEKYLVNYKPIIANFIQKDPQGGEVPLHQNWAFADETRCTTISLWCPLVNSTRENGTLEIVPGSHKRFGKVRGPMIRWELEDIKEEIIANDLVPMDNDAGHAVILDDSVVHYSSVNDTEGFRLTIQLILIPEEMPSIHYHMDPKESPTTVEVLEVDHDFYMNFNPWKKPDQNIKRISSFDYTPFSMSYSDFKKQLYGKRFDDEKSGFFKNLFTKLFQTN